MRTVQLAQKQPQAAHKLTDHITNQIVEKEMPEKGDAIFTFVVTPQMINNLGTLSFGVLNQIISSVVRSTMLSRYNFHSVIEQSSLYYFKLIQMDSEIEIRTQVIEVGRRSGKVEVSVYKDNIVSAKAIAVCQLMDPV